MKAFHNDPAIKAKYIARVKAHAAADALIRGIGWENGKGCAIGCTLEAYDHSRYPVELGLPEWLARLEDRIFESLPEADAMTWPLRLLEAIPLGANVEPVRWKLAVWRHTLQLERLAANHEPYANECRAAIQTVIDWCRSQRTGAWSAASAESAARSAALSAARSAESEASAARSAARSAAWSAAESATLSAESAARSAAWTAESEMLLKLLSEAQP